MRHSGKASLVLIGLLLASVGSAESAPYCLLRKPFDPPQGNCFQFYLADTAVAPPQTLAVVAGAACAATPYALRQGWLPDPTFPGPLPDWASGDSAMGVTSPYHNDSYGCHGGSGATAPTGSNGGAGGGSACQVVQTINQPEARDGADRVTVEASIIRVMNCPSGQIYVYEYLNRRGFRVIRPPNWAQSIGGQDFQTLDEAVNVAASAQTPQLPQPLQPQPQPEGATCPDGSPSLLGVCAGR
jgi:hypothetical protein